MERAQATTGKVRKRKAESQDNERLSKRLSLLNLGIHFLSPFPRISLANHTTERNGETLYVPVEHPTPDTPTISPMRPTPHPILPTQNGDTDDDLMKLDNTAHKVYIYDLDAELSSESDSDSPSSNRLVFLPDIQKHLRESRIPPMVLANADGELAGNNQLVLYNIPSSLTVPEERDSVRKAIIESRARARKVQQEERERSGDLRFVQTAGGRELGAREWYRHMRETEMAVSTGPKSGVAIGNTITGPEAIVEQDPMDDDPDAMDLG